MKEKKKKIHTHFFLSFIVEPLLNEDGEVI
jgi:hypothetical protein